MAENSSFLPLTDGYRHVQSQPAADSSQDNNREASVHVEAAIYQSQRLGILIELDGKVLIVSNWSWFY